MINRILILLLTLVLVFTNLPLTGASMATALAAPLGDNQPAAQFSPGQLAPCPNKADVFLFPPRNVTIPAVPPWGFPAYSGDPALEPLPNGFNVVERPAWFDGIPLTIRPFPRPSTGNGGPEDNHSDMYVFFYPDGTPVPQMPLLEAVPKNAAGPGYVVPDIAAKLFSANWEVIAVRVPQNYVPGTIKSLLDLLNPALVLEEVQTNIFVTFPVFPPGTTVPDLALNGLSLEPAMFEGHTVFFVEYDVWENEYSEKPLYLFQKPSGEFTGDAVVSAIQGMPHYNSLWDVFIVEVPEDYVANTLRSEDAVLASPYPIRFAFEVFAPVETVDGKRTRFMDIMDALTGPDGRFHKDLLPRQKASPTQLFDTDPRINPATLGFTSEFAINAVDAPRVIVAPPPLAVEEALLEALRGQVPNVCNKFQLPPHIARQRLITDANGLLTHLSQTAVDAMPLAEITARGQALFEREFTEAEGAGPAFNTYSCATCHGLPFNFGVEPMAGGGGGRFRNALQPTDTPDPNNPGLKLKRSRNAPHVFGSGILTQLGKERHAGGLPATDDNPWPHNWKGDVPTVRDFTAGALKGEVGLEAVEKVAEITGKSLAEAATIDFDRDSIVPEITVGDVTALTAFQAALPRPYQINVSDPKVIRGRQVFETTGCSTCHTPVQTLQSTILELTNPETSGIVRIPLGSPPVELFSDLKRHKMGALLAEPGPQGGIPADVFRTQPLWGLRDSAPYLHDGSANTIQDAIARHGGAGSEALPVITTYNGLSAADKSDLLAFLNSLVLPTAPELEVAFAMSLTPGDKAIVGPFLRNLIRLVPFAAQPLLFAWIVSPPPEGGTIKGQVTVQASFTAQAGVAEASLVVDNTTILPMTYNSATGFHEAILNTATLSEGDHKLSLNMKDKKGNELKGAASAFYTVDNILDSSPLNWPANWSGQPKDCVCIGTGLMAG